MTLRQGQRHGYHCSTPRDTCQKKPYITTMGALRQQYPTNIFFCFLNLILLLLAEVHNDGRHPAIFHLDPPRSWLFSWWLCARDPLQPVREAFYIRFHRGAWRKRRLQSSSTFFCCFFLFAFRPCPLPIYFPSPLDGKSLYRIDLIRFTVKEKMREWAWDLFACSTSVEKKFMLNYFARLSIVFFKNVSTFLLVQNKNNLVL